MGYTRYYSSLTKKFIMSLMGLFLITFLFVHLGLNLTVLLDLGSDNYPLFNEAAHFMATNPFIQVFQWVLFAGFIIHIFYGIVLQLQNWASRPKGYMVKGSAEENVFSQYMIYTGIVVFIFLVIHFVNFFMIAKGIIPGVQHVEVDGKEMENLGKLIVDLFSNGYYVTFYIIALLILGFHLDHGFQSAFQSLGLQNKKFGPFLKGLSHIVAVILTIGFIIIPLVIYFKK
jgi:succinate dehydrogenase / fumarate reductase cytochrome b subunit